MPEAKLPFHQSHAFLIGINEYQHINHLKTAERDARLIGHQLETHHGFTTHFLLGEEATLEGIRELIHHTIPQTVNETDSKPNRIILYFAGHGIALDSDNEPKGFLAPWDAEKEGEEKLLPMAELHAALKKDKVNCRHGLLILDCCFAGAFKWSSNKRHVTRRRPPKVIYETLFRRFTRDESWQAITSSSSDQTAADLINHLSLGHRDNGIWKDSPFVQQFDWEGLEEAEGQPINISQHSPFALALYIALQGEGDRIMKGGRGDGIITGREIYDYLRHWVELVTMSLQRRQTPLIIDLPRHDKGEFVFLHPKHPAFLSPDPGHNPYKGLLAFEEADEKFFFGREDAIKNIIKRLDSKPLTIMTGPAGSGKTSLAQAGIIPILRQKEWQILPTLPLGFKELEAERATLDKDTPSLLIIDDFEQLLATEATAIEHWEQYLMQLQNDFPKLKILLLVRTGFELYYSSTQPSDVEDKALQQWWALWENSKYRLAPLSKEELSDIIVLPARQAVLFFESEAMVNELVNSVYLAPGALPLLSYFLSALYEAYKKSLRTDRTFNSDDVKEIGGLIGALQKRATATYEVMKPEEQMMLRFLLMRMVKFENGLLSRRKVPFLKLDQVPESWEKGEDHIWSYFLEGEKINIYHELDFPNDFDDELLSKVIDKLEREEKLLVITKDEKTQQLYIEPVHDALITFWPMAQEWFREVGTDTILLQRQLWQTVIDHHQLQDEAIAFSPLQRDISEDLENTSLLWDSNPKLMQVTGAIVDSIRRENALAGLIARGLNLMSDADLKNLSPENKKIYDHLQLTYQIQVGDGKSSNNVKLLSALSSLNAFWANIIFYSHRHWLNQAEAKFLTDSWEKKEATIQKLIRQRDEARALALEAEAAALAAKGQMLAEKDPTVGLNYAYAGYLTKANEETTNALNSLGAAEPYYENVIHTDSKWTTPVTVLAFSPKDPNLLLSGSQDGVARLWDISTGKCIRVFDDNEDRRIITEESPEGKIVSIGWNYGIISADFSSDGRNIVTGCNDGSVVIWDVNTGEKIATIQAPEGEEKLMGTSKIAALTTLKVDFPKTKPNYTFAHYLKPLNILLTISPFGLIQHWSNDGQSTLFKYSIAEREHFTRQRTVICTALSPTGKYIALGLQVMDGITFDDNEILIIDRDDTSDPTRIRLISPPPAGQIVPTCLCFTSTENLLYAGFSDGCWKSYNIRTGKELLHIRAFTKPIRSMMLAKHNRRLHTGSEGNDIKIWNARTGYLERSLRGAFNQIRAITLSKGGTYIAHNYKDNIILWRQDQNAARIAFHFEAAKKDFLSGMSIPARQFIQSPQADVIVGSHPDRTNPHYVFYHAQSGQRRPLEFEARAGTYASFSPDGQYFISVHKTLNNHERYILMYNLKSRKEKLESQKVSLSMSGLNPHAVTISKKAAFLLIADKIKTSIDLVYLNDDSKTNLSGTDINGEPIEEIVLNDNQEQLLIRTESSVDLWEIKKDKLEKRCSFFPKNNSISNCVAFGKKPKQVFAGYPDFTAKLWEIEEEEERDFIFNPARTFRGHTEAVSHIAISPDGTHLLTGSGDGTVRLWDIESAVTIQTIPPYREPLSPEQEMQLEEDYERDNVNPIQPILSINFSKKGDLLIVGYKNGMVRSYYNILHHWPKACHQIPEGLRAHYKIPEGMKFPKKPKELEL